MNHSIKTNINLEHVRAFIAVAEHGGVNLAAEKLFKSPSTISHALSKLQDQLSLTLFDQVGRKLKLTPQGMTMLGRARVLLDEKQVFLDMAQHLQQEHRGEIAISVDAICPSNVLLDSLTAFSKQYPFCYINLFEDVLSGAEEKLLNGLVDLCVAYRVPQGFLGEKIMDIRFLPVVSATHHLANDKAVSQRALMMHRQVVIGDSGSKSKVDSGWLKASQRWTVSSFSTAIDIIQSGMAFGWIPDYLVQAQIDTGALVELQLNFGGEKSGALFIAIADENCPISQALAKILISNARLN